MVNRKVPARIAWAVELLDIQPDDQILEVGCGPGIAVSLVCDRLTVGSITAIDRSPTAIERTRARNQEHIASGRVALVQVDLAGLDVPPDHFDKAFAVDVNVFWTTTAEREFAVLKKALRRGGAVRLVYGEAPSGQARDVAGTLAPKLESHGFRTELLRDPTDTMVCIAGRQSS
jgi:SAM-dependent methyltransferase